MWRVLALLAACFACRAGWAFLRKSRPHRWRARPDISDRMHIRVILDGEPLAPHAYVLKYARGGGFCNANRTQAGYSIDATYGAYAIEVSLGERIIAFPVEYANSRWRMDIVLDVSTLGDGTMRVVKTLKIVNDMRQPTATEEWVESRSPRKRDAVLERMLACAHLLRARMMTKEAYNELLDRLFLENSDNALLLNLEFMSSDIDRTITCVENEFERRPRDVDYDAFGRYLMDGLKQAYFGDGMDLIAFSDKGEEIYRFLPDDIRMNEPFFALNYAGEPLTWGDSRSARRLYEEMFRFYNQQEHRS